MFDEEVVLDGVAYKLLRRLGHGAFGEVYAAAAQGDLGRPVAIKQLYSSEQYGICQRVQREIAVLQQLQHPNIVRLLGVASQGPLVNLVQQLALTDLAHLLSCCICPLPEPVFKALLKDLLQGLAELHAAGHMHRDIKPSNCLVSREGLLQLSDFGQARQLLADGPQRGPDAARGRCPSEPPSGAQHTSQPQSQTAAEAAAAAAGGTEGIAAAAAAAAAAAVPPSSPPQTAPAAPLSAALPQPDQSHEAAQEPAGYTAAVGTRWYRAPELLFGARCYGPAVDVWGAGMVAAEMLGLVPLVPGISDIDQLARLQQALGSITVEEWPAAAQLPDWHKIVFAPCAATPWHRLLPHAPPGSLTLLADLLRYDAERRPTAAGALLHPYFQQAPAPCSPQQVLDFASQQLRQAADRRRRLEQLHLAHQRAWERQADALRA